MDGKYVSRGGTKLAAALKDFGIDCKDKIVLDVGSSTGGFVDCLLQNGAAKIFSVDTAYGELAWTLRQNAKVVPIERTNILHLESLPESVDIVTIDITFTSLAKVLEVIKKFIKSDGEVIALLKPQYENQELALKNKGISPIEDHQQIIDSVKSSSEQFGFKFEKIIDSPILGGSGNKEYLVYFTLSP